MKIFVECHYLDSQVYSGASVYIIELYKSMLSFAKDVHFYFAASNIENLKLIFGEESNVHYVQTSKNKIYRLLFEIPRIIKRKKIDFAHFQYLVSPFCKCKIIDTLHDILYEEYPEYFSFMYRISRSILFKFSAKRADIVLTVSTYSKNCIIKRYGIPENKIYITPNAVNDSFYNIESDKADLFNKNNHIKNYILYVSRIEPRKNHFLLLKTYVEMSLWKKKLELVFIGKYDITSSCFDEYYENIPEKIKEHIHILSNVPFEDLKYWYRNATLFIYPTFAEGFGIPAIEAIAAKCPILCSNTTAMNDFPLEKDNFFNPNNPAELKDKIILFLENKAIFNSNVNNLIRKRYNWNNSAMVLYKALINEKNN